MKPNQVNAENEQQLLDTVYNYKRLITASPKAVTSIIIDDKKKQKLQHRRAMFKVGDSVRLSRYRTAFDKSYTPNWSVEVFKIRKVQYNNEPITYLLKDYQDIDIEGSVYAEELQSVKYPNVYLVENIIRKRDGGIIIKWYGFDSTHNTPANEADIF